MYFRKTIPAMFAVMALIAGTVLAGQPSDSQPKKEPQQSRFLRLLRDDDETPMAFQTAIVRYKSSGNEANGTVVDLIAAVHVAEKDYYELLNREFRKYDAVLYELVAPEGTKIPKGGRNSDSPVSFLQRGMQTILELEFQLDLIDYTRENMVHADMTPDQFAESMRRRGESVFGMFLRMMGYAIAQQNNSDGKATDTQFLMALFDKNRALALKRLMAEQFEDMQGMLVAMEGPKGSTMIGERNKAALAVLRKQIAAGKRKVAIFYGGGHMPDFHKRLGEDFGLVPVSTRWVVAWNLKSPEKPTKSEPTLEEPQ